MPSPEEKTRVVVGTAGSRLLAGLIVVSSVLGALGWGIAVLISLSFLGDCGGELDCDLGVFDGAVVQVAIAVTGIAFAALAAKRASDHLRRASPLVAVLVPAGGALIFFAAWCAYHGLLFFG